MAAVAILARPVVDGPPQRREDCMPRKAKRTSRTSARRSPTRKASPARTPTVPVTHGRYEYSPIIDRPVLRWPNGARVALWVIPNIEHFLFDRPATALTREAHALNPDVRTYSWRDYGVRVGIWR